MEALEIKAKVEREDASDCSTQVSPHALVELSNALATLFAQVVALYVKTKSAQRHMSAARLREQRLLLDEHATEISIMAVGLAERARKIGVPALSILGTVSRYRHIVDNDKERASPEELLMQLHADNHHLTDYLRYMRGLCARHNDLVTLILTEDWIDEAERRTWFLPRRSYRSKAVRRLHSCAQSAAVFFVCRSAHHTRRHQRS